MIPPDKRFKRTSDRNSRSIKDPTAVSQTKKLLAASDSSEAFEVSFELKYYQQAVNLKEKKAI